MKFRKAEIKIFEITKGEMVLGKRGKMVYFDSLSTGLTSKQMLKIAKVMRKIK